MTGLVDGFGKDLLGLSTGFGVIVVYGGIPDASGCYDSIGPINGSVVVLDFDQRTDFGGESVTG